MSSATGSRKTPKRYRVSPTEHMVPVQAATTTPGARERRGRREGGGEPSGTAGLNRS